MEDESEMYLVMDYFFLIGNSLKEGIENILEENRNDTLECGILTLNNG